MRRRLLPLGFALLVFARVSAAEDAQPPAGRPAPLPSKWNVMAECQMVIIPQKVALGLIPDLLDEQKIEPAFARLQEMIGRDEATLAANLVLRGEPERKLTAENVEELRYPTEYEPPDLPVGAPKESAGEIFKNWPYVGITPTAFEVRRVGEMLELTAQVSEDGKAISFEMKPEHVRLLRFAKYDAGVTPSGDRLFVEQPQFFRMADTFSSKVATGERFLAGIHKLPGNEKAEMELFIVRLTANRAAGEK